jgi:hypothetical protein
MSSTTHRRPIIIGVSITAVVVVGVAVVAFAFLNSGKSLGAQLEELNGQTRTTSYSTASQAPGRDIPTWLPGSMSNVTVEVPGPKSKGPGGIQVDADAPSDFALPASCQPTAQSFPWVGWSSLNVPSAKLVKCDGWIATIAHDHLYAWKA